MAVLAELLLVTAAVAAMIAATGAVLRSREWARRRAADRPGNQGLRLVPYALPLLLLAFLPRVAGPLAGGATFRDVAELWPTALVAAEVVAAAGAVVIASRLYALARLRSVSPRREP
jgi:hypothetical protein